MNVIVISSIVVAITLLIGAGIAGLTIAFSRAIMREEAAAEVERDRYNLQATMGHKITVDADADEQLKEAKTLAAKRAAAQPRGANVRIGQGGSESQPTAFDGIKNDPISAVKIASVYGWQLLQTGAIAGEQQAAVITQVAAQTAAPTKSPSDLVPGEDYPFIEITDDMDPAEKRKARIANAKARSAAVKALKEAAPLAAAPAADGGAPPSEQPVTVAPAAAAVAAPAIAEPVAGVDYEVIEITDDMDPADIRKARIANAKAKSAAMKAFKAAGGQAAVAAVSAPPVQQEVAVQTEQIAPAAQAVTTVIQTTIPKPEYIEIIDDMDPADIRQARIANAKAKSAYNKALKAAGIDPSTVTD
jgi:hypothetical protein